MNLCFVVGPYKTGTSAAAMIIESLGFQNPCHIDNRFDFAVGLSQARYYTLESSVVRSLNLRILDDLGYGLVGFSSPTKCLPANSTFLDVISFIETLATPRIVLKDPLFCWTLQYWLAACTALSIHPEVIFTYRESNLLRAWKNAPVPRMLLHDSPDILERIQAVAMWQANACARDGIKAMMASHGKLTSAARKIRPAKDLF